MSEPSSQLMRMRRVATGLLLVTVFLFILARSLESGSHAWVWVRAFAEAALVGALADWFAVTALFRHPLGLPIPHTAIVKKEKARIGEALARFVRGSFLSSEEVRRQWQKWQPVGKLVSWLREVDHARQVISWMVARLPRTLEEGNALSKLGVQALEKGAEALPVGKLISIGLQGFLKSSSRRAVMAPVLSRLGESIGKNREWVMDEAARSSKTKKIRLFDKLTRAATVAVSGKAVERLSAELIEAGEDEEHRLYSKIEQGLTELVEDLADGDDERWADLKSRVLVDEETRHMIGEVFRRAGQAILDGARELDEDGTLDEWSELLAQAVRKLQNSDEDLEERALVIVTRFTEHYGSAIETLISQTVASWEADELIHRLENQVGPDLQFIRINGTLIGGFVGVILHGLSLLIWS